MCATVDAMNEPSHARRAPTGTAPPTTFDAEQLRLGSDLRQLSIEPVRGDWVRVRRGVWIPAAAWAELTPTQQHAARVHATRLLIGDEVVYSHTAAAAVWGLPRIERWPTRVEVLVSTPRPRSSPMIVKHTGVECTPVVVHGIQVTPAARTIIDVARWQSLETAVAAADHALRHGLCRADDLKAEADALALRCRGRRQARLVVELADPLAESPGESLSRVQMFRHNIPRPALQVALEDEDGWFGRGDFGWDGVVGEFDGKTKYRIPEDATASDAARILWREKQREDRIRRDGRRVARWVYGDAAQGAPMVVILRRAGIHPVTPRTWFDLGGRTGVS